MALAALLLTVPPESPGVITFGDILQVVSTLVAAFAGAWFAFIYQNRQKAKEERRKQVSAGNRALATLLMQANTLTLYQRDMIDPHRDNPGCHFAIMPTLPYREEALTYDIAALDFLLHPKYAEVAFSLLLEEQRYREALKAINERSRFHREVVQPALERNGIMEGIVYREKDFRDALGVLGYQNLKQLTEAVIIHVDRTVDSLMAAKEELRKTLNELFPDDTFIDFEVLRNPTESIFKKRDAR